MKNRILQTFLLIVLIFSVSCSGHKFEKELVSVTYISPEGFETELRVSGERSYHSSGNKLKLGVKELTLEISDGSYIIDTEEKKIYIPKTYIVEVITKK